MCNKQQQVCVQKITATYPHFAMAQRYQQRIVIRIYETIRFSSLSNFTSISEILFPFWHCIIIAV